MYVFITKVESGGTFWRVAFNRILVAIILFNGVIALLGWQRASWDPAGDPNPGHIAAASVTPIVAIVIGFKIYCRRAFDDPIRFYVRGADRESVIAAEGFKRKDNLGKRYSHPAIHSKLIKPMVNGKVSPELLEAVLYGDNETTYTKSVFSEQESGTHLCTLNTSATEKNAAYEIVQEEDMDFANFQHRAEFGDHEYAGSDTASVRTSTPPPSIHGLADRRSIAPSPLAGGLLTPHAGQGYTPVAPLSPGLDPQHRHPSFEYAAQDNASETGLRLLNDQSRPSLVSAQSQGSGYTYHMARTPGEDDWQMNSAAVPYEGYEEYRGVYR